jgi:amino acid adenylation domain-containing protein
MASANSMGFRLSPQQKHLWSLQKSDCKSPYRAQCAVLISGNLDRAVLKEALRQVVNRHEILRSSFHRQPGLKVPLQVIAEAAEPAWQHADLSELGPDAQNAELEALFEEERSRPFSFDQTTLLRLSLIVLSSDSHILLINLPSLCGDSSTLKNLTLEISRSYAASLSGEELDDEPLQYADASEWQNEMLEADDADARSGKAFWGNQGQHYLSSLPFESKADDRQSESGPDSFTFDMDCDLLAKIDATSRKHHASANAYLLACWQSLLWRLTGQPEIVTGAVFDGRKYDELQRALGIFAKCLPVGCGFKYGIRFSEILVKVQKAMSDACDWQEYFTWEQGAAPAEDRLSLSVGFEFEDITPEYSAGGVSFSICKRYSWIYPFKLKLSCSRIDDSLTAEFYYDPGLLQASSVERIAKHFVALLKSSIENTEAPVDELEILSASDRHQLLVEFNRTSSDYPEDICIHELFERQVEQTPNSVAVVFNDRQLTYQELNSRANQLAHFLRKYGVGPDVCVGLLTERSAETFIGLLGILKAGGAYVALSPEHPKSRLSYQLTDIKATVLITHQQWLSRLPDFSGEVITIDGDQTAFEHEPKTNPAGVTVAQNLCYVIYTSGSTGTPKGVAITHQNLVNYTYFICRKLLLKAASADRALNFATLSTIAADLGNTCIFPCLVSGGCLHVMNYDAATDGSLFADYISKHSIDVLKIVPSHLNALLMSSEDLTALPRKYLILGGEALSLDLAERISKNSSDCEIINHYGPTETTVGSLTYGLAEDDSYKRVSSTVPIGRPAANAEAYILDKHLTPVPVGVAGELYIGGAGVARGYLNQPEQTAQRFIPNPFSGGANARLYKTGDLARYLPDGDAEFIGRVDYQVKVRGFRIEPGEIEAALARHPAVRQSVVTARESQPGDIRLVAYIVPALALDLAELREFLRAELSDYMMPSHFVMMKAMPLTPNGKVDRRALPAPEQAQAGMERTYLAPRTPIEEAVAKIWAALLRVEQVSVHDNFFDLGGHSLLVTQVVSRIRQQLKVELPLRSFFESPTVAGLAEKIELAQEEETTRMLAELEDISDEEAQRLLEMANQEEEGNDKAFSSGL